MTPLLAINLHSLFALQYLDPGAGSVVVQVVIAGIAGLAAVTKFYWGRIKGVLHHAPRDGSESELTPTSRS